MYGNDKNDFLQTQRIRHALDVFAISVVSMVIKKNMQNQNKFVGNSQSFAPRHRICVAIFIIWNHRAKSYGIKTTSYGIKTTSYGIKTTSYAHKTTSYAFKISTSLTAHTDKFQLTNMLFL